MLGNEVMTGQGNVAEMCIPRWIFEVRRNNRTNNQYIRLG